jgi:hypothetical protein
MSENRLIGLAVGMACFGGILVWGLLGLAGQIIITKTTTDNFLAAVVAIGICWLVFVLFSHE